MFPENDSYISFSFAGNQSIPNYQWTNFDLLKEKNEKQLSSSGSSLSSNKK